MAIKKFFTVRDGVVGTAHLDREEKEVDFRPVRPEWRGKELWLHPQDGVTKPVKPDVTAQEISRNLSSDGREERVTVERKATYLGVPFVTRANWSELTELGMRLESEARILQKKEEEERKLRRDAEVASWIDARLADPLAGGKFSAGKFRRTIDRVPAAAERLVEEWLGQFPLPRELHVDRWSVFSYLNQREPDRRGWQIVRDAALAADDLAREERRARHVGGST